MYCKNESCLIWKTTDFDIIKQQNHAHLHTVLDNMLHENCDVLSLKARIPSGRWHSILPIKQEQKIVANMIAKYRTFAWYSYYSLSSYLHDHSFFIWILRSRIRLQWKRCPIQCKSKKILISFRTGLQNPDPVHHCCGSLLYYSYSCPLSSNGFRYLKSFLIWKFNRAALFNTSFHCGRMKMNE